MRAACASVLRKSNAAVREELPCLDLVDRSLNQLAKLPALLFVDRGLQILNFGCVLSYKYDQGNLRDSGHPGITNELRIEGQKTFRLFRISGGGRFPVDDAFRSIHLSNRIDVRHEIGARRQRAGQLHLKIVFGASDLNAIVLSEPFEQVNRLVIEPVPGVILRIGERSVLLLLPLLEECGSWVFSSEISREGVLEAAAEDHGCSIFLLAPAVEVAVAILPRAAKVLANLREAVGHWSPPVTTPSRASWEMNSHSLDGANASRLRNVRPASDLRLVRRTPIRPRRAFSSTSSRPSRSGS